MTMIPKRRAGKNPERPSSAAALVPLETKNRGEDDTLEQLEIASERSCFDLYLRHQIPGRLRFYVPQIHSDEKLSAALAVYATRVKGTTSAKVNSWCGALIVTFDPAVISDRALIDELSTIPCRPLDPSGEKIPPALPVRTNKLAIVLNRFVSFLEDKCAPVFQFIFGGAGFAAAILQAPAIVTRILLAASIVPSFASPAGLLSPFASGCVPSFTLLPSGSVSLPSCCSLQTKNKQTTNQTKKQEKKQFSVYP